MYRFLFLYRESYTRLIQFLYKVQIKIHNNSILVGVGMVDMGCYTPERVITVQVNFGSQVKMVILERFKMKKFRSNPL
jgi:hypothetical protein